MQIQPYLSFDGQCRKAFEHYARVLGGTLESITTNGESPAAAEMPAALHDRIMHARLVVDDQVIMGSDSPPDMYQRPQGVFVSINVRDLARGERIYRALADGGTEMMPFQQTFWAAGFGMVVDRFGTPWMVNVESS